MDSSSETNGASPTPWSRTAWLGLIVGLLINVCAVADVLTLLSVEPGAAIRPMGLSLQLGILAILGLVVGAPMSFVAISLGTGRPRRLGQLGLLVNLLPFPLSALTLREVAGWVGFTFAP